MTPGNRLENYGKQAGDWIGSATAKAQEWAGECGHEAGDRLKAVGEDATELIRRYPIPTLLVGFTLGLVLARVVFSRR